MGYLPERPLKLRKGWAGKRLFGGAAALVLGLALCVGAAVYGTAQLRDRATARRVWHAGEDAADGSVRGKVERWSLLWVVPIGYEYDLEVHYQDQAGGDHHARLEVTSLFEKADTSGAPDIRYDPEDPSRVEVSWLADLRFGAWAWPLAAIAIGLLVGWGLVRVFATAVQAVRSARACGRQSEELEVRVVSLSPVKGRYGTPTGKWLLRYELPRSPLRRPGPRTVTLDGPPVPVPGRGDAVLALLSRASALPTFPLQDLAPFEVSEADRVAFAERLAKAGAAQQRVAGGA